MVRVLSSTNILMELRKVCQHPYLNAPEMEDSELPEEEQHKRLTDASGKLKFLKQLLPALKERGFRVLLFSQYKIALDIIEDFLYVEGYKYLRLDGDVAQVNRQKDMDKFNAPDSEYFIFLLTTRAGGVGINLATADAVILFDPDFNPQMDLQAISRSHRFGQTKRVLVFRLMMENSVETRIMNNGKRKMVLDHLVVQQLGKETEDGEIDNMILYGAEEIVKSDPNDTSADRVWTKELIDELIDGAEKEAEEQAKEQKEQEEQEEREEREATEDSAKARGGFAFARVWEAKTKKLQEVEDEEEEPEPFEDDNAWAEFMKSAEAQAKEDNNVILEEGRRRRARKQVTYTDPIGNIDDSPTKDKKRKGKKGKETDDTDFEAPVVSDSDSDSDAVFYDAVPEDIAEIGIVVPGAPAVSSTSTPSALNTSIQMNQAERMAWARKLQASQASQATQGGPAAHPMSQIVVPQTATAGPGPSTAQNQAAARAIRPQHNPGSSPVLIHDPSMSVLSHGPVYRPTNPGMIVPSVPQPQPRPQQPAQRVRPPTAASAIHTAQVEAARQILIELKGILQQTKNEAFLRVWYDVASFGTSAIARKHGYWEIAVAIDAMRHAQNLPQKFTLEGAVNVVAYYIDSGTRVRSLVSEESRRPPGPAPSSLPPAQYAPLIPPDHPLYVPVQNNRQPAPYRAAPVPRPPQPRSTYPYMPPNIQMVPMPQNGMPTHSVPHFQQRPPPPSNAIVHPQPRQAVRPYNINGVQMNNNGALINNNAVYQGHINLMPVHPAQPAPHYVPPPPITAQISAHISPVHSPVQVQRPTAIIPPPPRARISPIASPVESSKITEQQPRRQQAPAATPVAAPVAAPMAPTVTPAPPRTVIPLSSSFTANEVVPPTTDGSVGSVLQMGDSSRFSVPTPPPKHLDKGDMCFWCQSADHRLRDCPNLVPMAQLDNYEKELLAMGPTDEREQGLNAVRQLREAHNERAKKRKRKSRPSKGRSGTEGTSTPARGSVNGETVSPRTSIAAHGGKDATDAIVIDDDDEPIPPAKKHHGNGATAGPSVPAPTTVPAARSPATAQVPPRVSASSAFKPAPERTPLIVSTPSRPVAPAPAPVTPARSTPASSTPVPARIPPAPATVATSALKPVPAPAPKPAPAAPGPQPSQATSQQSQPTQAASQPETHGCQICLGKESHMAKECPVVKAGPESIAKAMERIKDDDLRNVLDMIRGALLNPASAASQEQPKCAFCGKHCGQSVRECAETRGSRKELKTKIRELELPLRESEAKMQILKARRVQLLAAPKSAERQDMLRQTDDDIANTERLMSEVQQPALHPLYQAYLSWPKPSRSDKAVANGA